jgi:hypothetical protein
MSASVETVPSTTPASAAATNWTPTTKVGAGVVAASATALFLPLLSPLWKKLTGGDLSAAEGAAFTTVITFVIQYLIPERR